MSGTYSFLDVHASLVGPGGAISLADGAGNAEEGIVIDSIDDVNTMTTGASGETQHSLHASRAGRVVVNLLKTSPVNALLAALYAIQTTSALLHGKNTLVLVTNAGDTITCQRVAFKKAPTLTYSKIGGMNSWEFDCGKIDRLLGSLA